MTNSADENTGDSTKTPESSTENISGSASNGASANITTNNASNNSGKWIVAVIIGGALWVGVSPFIGAMLVKDKHLELSGKAPEPLNIDRSGISPGYINQAREGKPYKLPADLQDNYAAVPKPATANTEAANTEAAKLPFNTNPDAVRDRFHSSIVAMKSGSTITPASSSVSKSAPTSADTEARMNAVTQLCVAGKNAEGLEEADRFLAYIDKTVGIDSQYKVATAALAMQMAANSHQLARAKSYSHTAIVASRASQDYLIEKIEPVYYELRGSTVNFANLQQMIKQYESDLDAHHMEKIPAQAKAIAAATASLPSESFFRLKARIIQAYSQYSADHDATSALRVFADIKKSAEAAGDQEMAKRCATIISGMEILK